MARRHRWKVDGEIVEQDAWCGRPEEWERLVAERPWLAEWGVFRFPDLGLITAVSFPAGVVVPRKRNVNI